MESRRSFIFNRQDYLKQKESNDSEGSPDDFEMESEVLSHVQTYFDISSRRVIEVVPMICDTSLGLKLVKQLTKAFAKQLGIVGTNGLANSKNFLQEDAAVIERRRWLRRQEEIVSRAEQILSSIIH